MIDGKDRRPMGSPARIRAALAYSGYDQTDITEALDISKSKLGRWLSGSEEGNPPDPSDLERLAQVCDVPLWFLENGYREPDTEPGLERRLRLIEQRLQEMVDTRAEVLGMLDEIDERLVKAGVSEAVGSAHQRVEKRRRATRRQGTTRAPTPQAQRSQLPLLPRRSARLLPG